MAAKKASADKTAPTQLSVKEYVDAIPDEPKRADAKALVALMQKATGEKAKMWGPSIIGFGSYHYVYESGREGDMPLIGFSPRKAATVFYGLRAAEDHEDLLGRLGKYTTGKGCVYVKKLADVDLAVLETLIAQAVAASRAGHAAAAKA